MIRCEPRGHVVTCHASPGPVISVTRVTSGVSTEQTGAVSSVSVSARVRFYHHWMTGPVTDSLAKISGTRVKFLDTKHRPAWPA